ncbi:hypothetical protein, partial [Frankia sp. QA3]|uniref:hypothetical protein n=1 Tax=Frankia sp. QA3 TaxID=710111 RepID=UPI000269C50C
MSGGLFGGVDVGSACTKIATAGPDGAGGGYEAVEVTALHWSYGRPFVGRAALDLAARDGARPVGGFVAALGRP